VDTKLQYHDATRQNSNLQVSKNFKKNIGGVHYIREIFRTKHKIHKEKRKRQIQE
jgi:hypothetical protein